MVRDSAITFILTFKTIYSDWSPWLIKSETEFLCQTNFPNRMKSFESVFSVSQKSQCGCQSSLLLLSRGVCGLYSSIALNPSLCALQELSFTAPSLSSFLRCLTPTFLSQSSLSQRTQPADAIQLTPGKHNWKWAVLALPYHPRVLGLLPNYEYFPHKWEKVRILHHSSCFCHCFVFFTTLQIFLIRSVMCCYALA